MKRETLEPKTNEDGSISFAGLCGEYLYTIKPKEGRQFEIIAEEIEDAEIPPPDEETESEKADSLYEFMFGRKS